MTSYLARTYQDRRGYSIRRERSQPLIAFFCDGSQKDNERRRRLFFLDEKGSVRCAPWHRYLRGEDPHLVKELEAEDRLFMKKEN